MTTAATFSSEAIYSAASYPFAQHSLEQARDLVAWLAVQLEVVKFSGILFAPQWQLNL